MSAYRRPSLFAMDRFAAALALNSSGKSCSIEAEEVGRCLLAKARKGSFLRRIPLVRRLMDSFRSVNRATSSVLRQPEERRSRREGGHALLERSLFADAGNGWILHGGLGGERSEGAFAFQDELLPARPW